MIPPHVRPLRQLLPETGECHLDLLKRAPTGGRGRPGRCDRSTLQI